MVKICTAEHKMSEKRMCVTSRPLPPPLPFFFYYYYFLMCPASSVGSPPCLSVYLLVFLFRHVPFYALL